MKAGFIALASAAAASVVPDLLDQFSHDAQLTFTTPELSQAYDDLLAGQPHKNLGTFQYDDLSAYTVVSHRAFPEHRLMLKQPRLCDPTVVQYSGYLDISESRHLFFWFFESRSNPTSDPLVMWLNGGPGCSSSTGLLFELGPCSISDQGRNTTANEYSWNSKANMIFLDQPIQVGYSWSDGDSVNNSQDSAKDVYAFLQLFYQQFPKYKQLPFSLAAESYGGHYAPSISSEINKRNKNLKLMRLTENSPLRDLVHIPLESVLIGNGVTEPFTQFGSIPDYACAPSEYAIFDEGTCARLRSSAQTCQRLVSSCYSSGSRFACVPAAIYCNSNLYGPIQQAGLNPYDIRRKCDRNGEDGPLCYKEMGWIETFLNDPEVKGELGVPSSVKFESCNMQVNQAFMFAGDGMKDRSSVIPEMLQDGIRFLIYAGEYDYMCNWMGNLAWVSAMDSIFKDEFNAAEEKPFKVGGKDAGVVKSAGKGAGSLTFVKAFGGGHMIPMDQPKNTLTMLNKWLANEAL